MVRLVSLAAAAAMVLTMGGCATPSAEKSSTEGRAAATATASDGETDRTWRWLSKYFRPGKEPRRPGDLPPGRPGLFSGKDGEIVLYRKGEVDSPDSTKPSKMRR